MRRMMMMVAMGVAMGVSGMAVGAGLETAKVGEVVSVGGKEAVVKEMDVTPVVKNEYSGVFHFDSFGRPGLKELRAKYGLDKVIAPGKDEFDKQVLLCAWVNKMITFGAPQSNPKDALAILKAAGTGQQFNCGFFAMTLEQAASSLGWVVRDIGLKGAKGDGNGDEHSVCEIWSNQYRKWVMLDPTSRMYVEKDGRPLNAWEIRQEWFYHEGKDLTFVVGAERKKVGRADLPIQLGTFKGFGPLTVNANSIGKFLIIMYLPITETGGPDFANMFIVKDKLAEGVWIHTRKNPADPGKEAYWPMNQAGLKLSAAGAGTIKVESETAMPDFAAYRSRVDGKAWSAGLAGSWTLHGGSNSLEVVPVNKFGVEGVVSRVVLEVK